MVSLYTGSQCLVPIINCFLPDYFLGSPVFMLVDDFLFLGGLVTSPGPD